MKVKTAIIEDQSILVDAYTSILNKIPDYNFDITRSANYDEAIQHLKINKTDLVILDLQLSTSQSGKHNCGEDIAEFTRKHFPKTKIIILTNITNRIRIKGVQKYINPESLMIKSNINSDFFRTAIIKVLNNGRVNCSHIDLVYCFNWKINESILDKYDRKIIYYLSEGEKTKDLKNFIPLSTRTIEVRKSKLIELLNHKNDVNFNLIKEAKKLGFI